jgi:hypothetical protein
LDHGQDVAAFEGNQAIQEEDQAVPLPEGARETHRFLRSVDAETAWASEAAGRVSHELSGAFCFLAVDIEFHSYPDGSPGKDNLMGFEGR